MNWFVFRFQRHSDHHMYAYKIYPTLDITTPMPLFPFDFVTGVILSQIPPLWYAIMNPLVDEVIENKKASTEHHKFVKRTVKMIHFVSISMFIIFAVTKIGHKFI